MEEKKVEEDVFGDAFNTASEISEVSDQKSSEEAGEVIENPPATPEEEQPKEVKETVEEPPKVKTETKEEDSETDRQRYLTLQGIHKHDREAWDSEKAELLAQIETLKKSAAPSKPAEETADESPEDEEDKQYDEDFDIVSKVERRRREAVVAKLHKEIEDMKQSLKDELLSQIAPATKAVAEAQQERHFEAIRKKHSDYETYVNDGSLLKWIESKPSYLIKTMKEVYENGTADDVIELITNFKQENKITDTSENDAKKAEKKMAMIQPVTRRAAVNAAMNVANDFEGAFEEAANKQGGY